MRDKARRVLSHYDITLVLLVILLCVFGIVMIYSTSSFNASKYYQDSAKYLKRQSLWAGIGLVIMFAVSMFDYRLYKKATPRLRFNFVWFAYGVCVLLEVLVTVGGYVAGGSSRWLKVFEDIGMQPSEFSKIGVLMVTAYMAQRIPGRLKKFSGFLAVMLINLPLLGMIAATNLSTAIIVAGIMTMICFVTAEKKGYFVIVLILLVLAALAFIYLVPGSEYRADRIDSWLHPEKLEPGSQILEGLYAIASGGFFGKGLGASSLKLGYISEVHTDMIFTIICEELGIFGAILVIAIYLMLLWRLYVIARNAPDMFGALLTTGVFANIALQFLLNIAVVTYSIPATGIPLPFISYGGSSLVVMMIEIGLALSVSKYTTEALPEEEEYA